MPYAGMPTRNVQCSRVSEKETTAPTRMRKKETQPHFFPRPETSLAISTMGQNKKVMNPFNSFCQREVLPGTDRPAADRLGADAGRPSG